MLTIILDNFVMLFTDIILCDANTIGLWRLLDADIINHAIFVPIIAAPCIPFWQHFASSSTTPCFSNATITTSLGLKIEV